jgi:hypothetical protein
MLAVYGQKTSEFKSKSGWTSSGISQTVGPGLTCILIGGRDDRSGQGHCSPHNDDCVSPAETNIFAKFSKNFSDQLKLA